MATEERFDFTDDSGSDHIVRITKELGGSNFSTWMRDIEDIDTGEQFKNIPMTRLRRRPA